jgi:hypothetical protein
MGADLGVYLFDVVMLAGMYADRAWDSLHRERVPFCPMLSQGWGLLRVKNVRVPPELEEARVHLRPSLWTTFDNVGMKIILDLFKI